MIKNVNTFTTSVLKRFNFMSLYSFSYSCNYFRNSLIHRIQYWLNLADIHVTVYGLAENARYKIKSYHCKTRQRKTPTIKNTRQEQLFPTTKLSK